MYPLRKCESIQTAKFFPGSIVFNGLFSFTRSITGLPVRGGANLTVFDYAPPNKMRPPLHFLKNRGDVFSDYAYRKEID